MPELERNHYIQNKLLKNFATHCANEKDKICVLNLLNFSAEYRNTDRAFYLKNFYDINEGSDAKELERKFKDRIEDQMGNIIEKCVAQNKSLIFSRTELGVIKKYILLQLYRTPHNQKSYINIPEGAFELSQFNLNQNESKESFWKREMLTILDSDWDTLLTTDMVGIKKHTMEINSAFLMFVHTKKEFCINDLGYTTERIPVSIPKEKEDAYIKASKTLGKELFGQDNFDELAKREIANKSSFLDNFVLFPISANMAILSVSPLWKMLYLHPELLTNNDISYVSGILLKHLSLPQPNYVNSDKIKCDADIQFHKNPDDKYKYKIHSLSAEETAYLNHLIINETFAYIGLKTPSKFLKTIKEYNRLASNNTVNVKKNLLGFVELLSN